MTVADDSGEGLVAQLRDTWDATAALLEGLEPAAWDTLTDLPGWSVQDVAVHMIGTESMLAGRETPAAPDRPWPAHVHNDIGALNEAWVESRRTTPPAEVLAQWRAITAVRLTALEAMTDEELDAPSWTPVGNASYRRFMQIRVFDCWVHEQDLRRALDRPGHGSGPAADASIDEVERALGYIVGKKAQAPAGTRLTFTLTGATQREIHVEVAGRAAVVEELGGPATATLELDAVDFVALACGRLEAPDVAIRYGGDEALGRAVAGQLAFTV